MIQLIDELINIKYKYNVNALFEIFKYSEYDTFIRIELTRKEYKVTRIIDYTQWLVMSDEQRDYILSETLRELKSYTEQERD